MVNRFRFSCKDSDNVFIATLSSKLGLQFLINRFSRFFFSKTFITTCLCDILRLTFILACFSELMKTAFISSQKVSQNSLNNPSLPRDLLLGVLFIDTKRLSSVISVSNLA